MRILHNSYSPRIVRNRFGCLFFFVRVGGGCLFWSWVQGFWVGFCWPCWFGGGGGCWLAFGVGVGGCFWGGGGVGVGGVPASGLSARSPPGWGGCCCWGGWRPGVRGGVSICAAHFGALAPALAVGWLASRVGGAPGAAGFPLPAWRHGRGRGRVGVPCRGGLLGASAGEPGRGWCGALGLALAGRGGCPAPGLAARSPPGPGGCGVPGRLSFGVMTGGSSWGDDRGRQVQVARRKCPVPLLLPSAVMAGDSPLVGGGMPMSKRAERPVPGLAARSPPDPGWCCVLLFSPRGDGW